MKKFQRTTTLPAGCFFHGDAAEDVDHNGAEGSEPENKSRDPETWDLGDLTLQCGRKGDSLKLAVGWIYYGSSGYEAPMDAASDTAAYLATLVDANPDLTLLSENPPPCFQVCFYFGTDKAVASEKEKNSWRTKEIARRLVGRGFMVDYAPGEFGLFFRAVVHLNTRDATVESLVTIVVEEAVS